MVGVGGAENKHTFENCIFIYVQIGGKHLKTPRNKKKFLNIGNTKSYQKKIILMSISRYFLAHIYGPYLMIFGQYLTYFVLFCSFGLLKSTFYGHIWPFFAQFKIFFCFVFLATFYGHIWPIQICPRLLITFITCSGDAASCCWLRCCPRAARVARARAASAPAAAGPPPAGPPRAGRRDARGRSASPSEWTDSIWSAQNGTNVRGVHATRTFRVRTLNTSINTHSIRLVKRSVE